MTFFNTRPRFHDRDIRQVSGDTITLSGETNINGVIRLTPNAVPGYVITALDSDGTFGWQVNASGSTGGGNSFTGNTSGDCITDLYVSNLHGCTKLTIYGNLESNTSTAGGINTSVLGYTNTSDSNYTFIGGGSNHIISGSPYTVIGGGAGNEISSSSLSFIGGGAAHLINGGSYNTIGGGKDNTIYSSYSSIIGGESNIIGTAHTNTHIIGSNITSFTANTTHVEKLNVKTLNGTTAITALALDSNGMVVDGSSLDTGGAFTHTASGRITPTNAYGNTVSANYSTIGGGNANTISSNDIYSSIVGGSGNTINTTGVEFNHFIGGGVHHTIDGYGYYGGNVIVGGGNIYYSRGHSINGGAGNFIGGGAGESNIINGSTYDSVIVGGEGGLIDGSNSFIGGGEGNTIRSIKSTIGGGNNNTVSGSTSSVVGGASNVIDGIQSFIGGGSSNRVGGGSSSVLGGYTNIIQESFSTIGGGTTNYINSKYTSIGGGKLNTIKENTGNAYCWYSKIGGGFGNEIQSYNLRNTLSSFIGGGNGNKILSNPTTVSNASYSVIGGGSSNLIQNINSFIGGGENNIITGGTHSSIIGGQNNFVNHSSSHIIGSNIISFTANTTHVEKLNVKTLNGTTAVTSLALDTDGMVVDGGSLIGPTGSGTTDYVTRWTAPTTLGVGIIQDDGSTVGIGASPVSFNKVYVDGDSSSLQAFQANASSHTASNTAIRGQATAGSDKGIGGGFMTNSGAGGGVLWGIQTGTEISSVGTPLHPLGGGVSAIGVGVEAKGNTTSTGHTFGVYVETIISNPSDNIGMYINTTNAGAGNSYAMLIEDGNEGSGKVLTSDSDGFASWQVATGGGGVTIDPFETLGSIASITWDVSGTSTNYEATLTGNTTLTMSNVRNGDFGTLIVTQDGTGSHTLTFGAGTHLVVNGGGGVPTITGTANAVSIVSFVYNGSTFYWTVGNDYT